MDKILVGLLGGVLIGYMLGIVTALPIGIKAFVDNLEAQEVYHVEDGQSDVHIDFRLGPFSYRKEVAKPQAERKG